MRVCLSVCVLTLTQSMCLILFISSQLFVACSFTHISLRWVLFDVGEVGVCIVAPGSPPRDVRARPVSSSTVVVQWNEPEIPNGVVRVRLIYQNLFFF